MAEGASVEIGRSKKFDIVGLGMSMIDLFQVVDEFPTGVGVTEASSSRLMGGGPVPTAVCASAQLGAKSAIIDRIGDDWRGDLVRREYESFRVDTTHLQLEPDKTTTCASVLVRKRDGERHIVFSPGNFTPLTTDELPIDLLQSTKILHLNGRHWPACIEAAQVVKKAGGKVSFDGGANRFEDKFHDLLPLVDILIVARDFAERLSTSSDRDEQFAALHQWGAEITGITEGEKGSWIATGKTPKVFHQPAFPIESVMDTTGCGDVFHGAFLSQLARGEQIEDCARVASAAAANNATELGGRGKLPTRIEVVRMLDLAY